MSRDRRQSDLADIADTACPLLGVNEEGVVRSTRIVRSVRSVFMERRPFAVEAASGDLRPASPAGVQFDHHWTSEGVDVQSDFTGGHLLNLAIAGCVLNDVHREAERMGIAIRGVKVSAWGDFDRQTWHSTGVSYTVVVASPASPTEIDGLLRVVDHVAEIPKALRAGAAVEHRRESLLEKSSIDSRGLKS